MATPPYVPPSVGPAGLVVAGYQSILQDNLQIFLNIYGQDQYIQPDSAIYQFIAAQSLKQAHQNQGLQLAYNQSSAATAVGAGLDRQAKNIGIARLPLSFSTAQLNLTGTAGAVITNGAAQDANGNLWTLPASVTLTGGAATVTGTCTTPGDVAAPAGTINIVATPSNVVPSGGWTTVTNPAAAVQGTPTELDSQFRARYSISVALPSLTPLEATIAAILAITGVTRVAPGYPTPGGPGTSIENPTGGVDSWGNPAHSVSFVVEGATDLAVATAIYSKKTPGAFANGTTAVVVTDPLTGMINTMRFFRPSYLPVYVVCHLIGYGTTPSSALLAQVQTVIVSYLNGLSIGETVSVSALIFEVMQLNANLSAPSFGVAQMLIGTGPGSVTFADLVMPNFYYVSQGLAANVSVVTP